MFLSVFIRNLDTRNVSKTRTVGILRYCSHTTQDCNLTISLQIHYNFVRFGDAVSLSSVTVAARLWIPRLRFAPRGMTVVCHPVGGRVPRLTHWVIGMSPLRGYVDTRASQAYALGYRNVAPSGLRRFPGRYVFPGLTPWVIGMSPLRGYADSRASTCSQGLRPGL
jgi:hypothetical protein